MISEPMTATSNARYNKLAGDPNPNPKPNINGVDIFVVLSCTVFISGAIAVLAWDFYHPDFPEFTVSRFEVSNFNLSSNSLTSNFNLSIAIQNPHKKWSVIYDDVHAGVLYSTGHAGKSVLKTDDFVIAETPMFPFSQGPRNVTDLKVKLGTVGFYVNDEDRIRSDDGDVRFGVRVSSTAWFKAGAWTTAHY